MKVQRTVRSALPIAASVASLISQSPASAFVPSQPATADRSLFGVSSSTSKAGRRRIRPFSTSSSLSATWSSEGNARDEEENDDGWLDDSTSSVSWLPPSSQLARGAAASEPITQVRRDATILPLYPVGTAAFAPHSVQSLPISEPRYVEMYEQLMRSDDLVDGAEIVVAMRHPTESGKFTKYGVLLKVVDFVKAGGMELGFGNDVEEKANVKYVARHEVTGIVNIHRILNPCDWDEEETYLRVEATVVDDLSEEETRRGSSGIETSGSCPNEEVVAMRDQFAALVEIQHDLNQEVRFAPASIDNFARGVGGCPRGFWQTVLSWQQYAEQCALSRHAELQGDFEDKLTSYLGRDKDNTDAIDIAELPPHLQDEATEVGRRVNMELGQLRLENSLGMQRLLEANDHKERVRVFSSLVGGELRRLQMKKSVKAIFEADMESNEEERSMATSPSELKATEEAVKVRQMRLKLEHTFGVTTTRPGTQKPQPIFYDDVDAFR